MRRPKFIEIVLENCEVFTFEAKDVCLKLDGIGLSIWGEIIFKTAKDACIFIDKKATASGGWDNEKWQDRIHQDITQIHINYTDGTTEGYHLDWDIETSDYRNSYETDIDDGNSMIYIVSKTKKSQDDF